LSQKDVTVALKIKDLPILFQEHNKEVVIDQHKDKPSQKPRYEQKSVQSKQRRIISPVLKKKKM